MLANLSIHVCVQYIDIAFTSKLLVEVFRTDGPMKRRARHNNRENDLGPGKVRKVGGHTL